MLQRWSAPPLLVLPAGFHLEIRRCLRERCPGVGCGLRRWETVKCLYDPPAMPSYDDYIAGFLYATVYPHAYLVAVRSQGCRRRLVEGS